jgi:hypothetical protein
MIKNKTKIFKFVGTHLIAKSSQVSIIFFIIIIILYFFDKIKKNSIENYNISHKISCYILLFQTKTEIIYFKKPELKPKPLNRKGSSH